MFWTKCKGVLFTFQNNRSFIVQQKQTFLTQKNISSKYFHQKRFQSVLKETLLNYVLIHNQN